MLCSTHVEYERGRERKVEIIERVKEIDRWGDQERDREAIIRKEQRQRERESYKGRKERWVKLLKVNVEDILGKS